jgi:hypothetical protein
MPGPYTKTCDLVEATHAWPVGRPAPKNPIAKTAPVNHIGEFPEPYPYLPWWRDPTGLLTFIVETSGPAASLAPSARKALIGIDRRLDSMTIATM